MPDTDVSSVDCNANSIYLGSNACLAADAAAGAADVPLLAVEVWAATGVAGLPLLAASAFGKRMFKAENNLPFNAGSLPK